MSGSPPPPTRRDVLAAGLGAALLPGAARAQAVRTPPPTTKVPMLTRPIPKSGEALPVIGLGTWQTFDVGADPAERAPLKEVLRRFLDSGARLVDSSPMYGRAERVVGDVLASLGDAPRPFLASKVWTTGRDAGRAQLEASVRDMGHGRMDLLQVHNLVDWRTHLPVLREWKAAGRVRYVGITHYARGAFDELERLMRDEPLDFVQLPYSLALRDAEKRLLPAAAAHGVAVLVMQPFATGDLFQRVRGKPLPEWAADFDCGSWAQFFLKFVLGHPAVNCPLPATSKPEHVADNLRAGLGRLPDEKTRARMARVLAP
ncbi:aldo/keto reductase [Myxococcus sp. K15C18031901]|uniref:aldo/keto reductase n=1 Tax=Myxococcus dinghuensis TaxID=2906761 RepID=UPI0020A73042|nr:aldo/keto reductase [Myxococcus dinghuensis]MCP3098328.1 aldo/keto reductase [Myxococcus dinghuensis]